MNAITQAKPPSPAEQLRHQLAVMGPELKNALPSHIKPEKFQRVVMTVVQQQPDLLVAERKSLLGSCMKCAADGLVPDGREAALVIFNTKNKDGSWEKRVQYMPMMGGILKRIRNSGEIASVQAHVIHENDKFVIRRGLNETIEHEPLFPGERGKPIGAYAVAKFKDGSDPVFEVMDIDAINRVRAVSRAKDSGPWAQWWEEMARKTVFRRLSKWLPMDTEAVDLIRRDDETGAPTEISNGPTIDGSVEPSAPQIEAPSSKLDSLDGMTEEIDAETGEILPPSEADPTRARAEALAAEVSRYASEEAARDFAKRADVRKLMTEWKASRPELFKLVEDATEARIGALAQEAA